MALVTTGLVVISREGVSIVSDIFVLAMSVGLCALTWGLIVLCDRLQGGKG